MAAETSHLHLFSSKVDKDDFTSSVKKYATEKDSKIKKADVFLSDILRSWSLLEKTGNQYAIDNFIIRNESDRLNVYFAPYEMKVEMTIVDDLGLKLYDKVSAVVAELIANSYDADAEAVEVLLPLGKTLLTKNGDKSIESEYRIRIIDNGKGMTHDEANTCYLKIGRHKRDIEGEKSKKFEREFMGRKGIGKLAPFGICKKIEVRSAGGTKTEKGYQVAHFELDYEKIKTKSTERYYPTVLKDDGMYEDETGTTIILKDFNLGKRVPDKETFERQLASRFGLTDRPEDTFTIKVTDVHDDGSAASFSVPKVKIPLSAKMDFDSTKDFIETETGVKLPISGWIGFSKQPHKHEELAGVRIYVRQKLAALTRDFGIPSGFWGEILAHSYLVGELSADWLDAKEDLIQTHRQDILWTSEEGKALTDWGREKIKELSKKGRKPHEDQKKDTFIHTSKLEELAKKRFSEPKIQHAAIELGKQLGANLDDDTLGDPDQVSNMAEFILGIAPYKLFVDVVAEMKAAADEHGKIDIAKVIELLKTSGIAQTAAYGSIAYQRVMAIKALRKLKDDGEKNEQPFQKALESAPWIINPQWVPITANRAFKTFRKEFEAWYKKTYGCEISTTCLETPEGKRPDFVLLHQDEMIIAIEIKPPDHPFDDTDFGRMSKYVEALEEYFDKEPGLREKFPGGFKVIVVADTKKIHDKGMNRSLELWKSQGKLAFKTWNHILRDSEQAHDDFLKISDSLQTEELQK